MTISAQGSSERGLLVGHLNVYHLCNKVPDVDFYLNETSHLHIFGLSESRLDSRISDAAISIPGYFVFRRDPTSPGHTGLVVYIRQSFKTVIHRRLDLESEEVECMWFELKNSTYPHLLVGFIYRNPSSTLEWFDSFVHLMDKVNDTSKNVLLLGDFNIDLFKSNCVWRSIVSLFGLKQLIQTATRVTSSTSTLIDHIYTNNLNAVLDPTVPRVSISDHFPVTCTWSCKLPKPARTDHIYISYRAFKKLNEADFLYDLSMAPFDNVYIHSDPNKALTVWYELFLTVLNKHAPLRRRRVRQKQAPSWLNDEIRQEMKNRDTAKRDKRFSDYKKYRNRVKYLIREAKKVYVNNTIERDCSSASVWKALKTLTNSQGNAVNIPSNISPDMFNEHFLSAAMTLTHSDDSDDISHEASDRLFTYCNDKLSVDDNFHIPFIAVHEVGRSISNIKQKHSAGLDGINGYILNLAQPYVVESLTYIYNLCIQQGVVPIAFKNSKIIPIPKSKDLTKLNNYRPISVLSTLSKPLERHVHDHLLIYLERRSLLVQLQSGFRPKHSCHTALARMTNSWLRGINDLNLTGVVFLDLKKAFDLINHNILLDKLSTYLRNPLSQNFFRSYLEERKQKVYVNGRFSSEGNVHHGVPQGSILGPLLFCIYMNDLPLFISSSQVVCDMFADDTTLHSAGRDTQTIADCLQHSLHEVSEWCKSNGMMVNPLKTKSMIITSRQKHQLRPLLLNLSYDSVPICQVSAHRLLGVTVDDRLSWQPHADNLCISISKKLFLLSKLKNIIDTKTRKLFFHAYIKPLSDYASTIWDGLSEIHFRKINSLYRRAIKLILPDVPFTTDQKFRELELLPLSKQLIFNKCIFMFKILNGKTPSYLSDIFIPRNLQFAFNRNKLRVPWPRIDLFKTSLSYSGSTMWNSLPQEITSVASFCAFKKRIKIYCDTPVIV